MKVRSIDILITIVPHTAPDLFRHALLHTPLTMSHPTHVVALEENTQTANYSGVKDDVVEVLKSMNLDTIATEIRNMSQVVTQLQTTQNEFKASLEFTQKEFAQSKKEIISQGQQLKCQQQRLEFTENKVTELEKKISDTRVQLLKNQCHTMKDNLTFHLIPEDINENTRTKLIDFLKTTMKVPPLNFVIKDIDTAAESDTIWIKRCHRYGQTGYSGQPRPIVAVFVVGRDCVLKHARNLAGTIYHVSQQLPPEQIEAKNKVAPIFRDAKAQGRRPRYVGHGDVVKVDGKTYSAPVVPLCTTSTQNILTLNTL